MCDFHTILGLRISGGRWLLIYLRYDVFFVLLTLPFREEYHLMRVLLLAEHLKLWLIGVL